MVVLTKTVVMPAQVVSSIWLAFTMIELSRMLCTYFERFGMPETLLLFILMPNSDSNLTTIHLFIKKSKPVPVVVVWKSPRFTIVNGDLGQ